MAGTLLAGCGSKDSSGGASQAPAAGTEAKTEAAKTEAAKTESDTAAAGTDASVVTEPTELIFIFADGDEGAKASMNEIVNRFNETYQDITVKIQPGNGGAYSEFLKTKESVGEFPDVMEMRDTPMYYFLI